MTLLEGIADEHKRVRWLTALLIAGIAFDLIAILSGFAQFGLLSRVAAGGAITDAEASSNDARQALIGGLQVIGFIATAICWLVWLHSAYRNLSLMGTKLTEYTPGWAVGYWFIPFLNLLRPYQVTKELWLRSARRNEEPIASLDAPTIVSLWWGLYLLCGFFGRLVMVTAGRAEAVDAVLRVTMMSYRARRAGRRFGLHRAQARSRDRQASERRGIA
jgi:hypothetical protein